jgi:isopentenyl diphosphate isomerase/L-lactate dehydrogenase-like FMN-dependent dehydrogenase
VGRPYAYALAAGGQAGVESLMADFTAELDLTLALSGWTSVEGLGPEALQGA